MSAIRLSPCWSVSCSSCSSRLTPNSAHVSSESCLELSRENRCALDMDVALWNTSPSSAVLKAFVEDAMPSARQSPSACNLCRFAGGGAGMARGEPYCITTGEQYRQLICNKRYYEFAFVDPFAMLSRPYVAFASIVALRFRGEYYEAHVPSLTAWGQAQRQSAWNGLLSAPLSRMVCFRGGFRGAAENVSLSENVYGRVSRKLSRPAFWLLRRLCRTPHWTTYNQGLWRCSGEPICETCWPKKREQL